MVTTADSLGLVSLCGVPRDRWGSTIMCCAMTHRDRMNRERAEMLEEHAKRMLSLDALRKQVIAWDGGCGWTDALLSRLLRARVHPFTAVKPR
jgi:hypothetical protein